VAQHRLIRGIARLGEIAFKVVGHTCPALQAHQREELVSDAAVEICPMVVAILYRKISRADRARKMGLG